jgi:hypothetical protein
MGLLYNNHVLSTAHRRFDHAVTVGAFGYLDPGAIIRRNNIMHQFLAAFTASH